jgi:glutamyl-tRNA reductase
MHLVLIGMNHRTAPLDIRERLSLSCGEEGRPLAELLAIPGVDEAFYLNTCNRVEVLAGTGTPDAALAGLRDFVLRHGNLSGEMLERCLYLYRDEAAVRHLFRVTASLDSLVMGEPQILGQVKDAYRRSAEANAAGAILNRVLHHAFRTAKRVRTETAIAANAVSVSFAAVELAKKIFGDLRGKTGLLVGAGEMSELAARHLLGQGVGRIVIANRTLVRAQELAAALDGEAVGFERLPECLEAADIVIASTGSPGYVVTAEMVGRALHRRRNRLLFLVDIAVPRDVEPAAARIDNVYLYNIDDLQGIVDANLAQRREEARKAEGIIDAEVANYLEWFNTLEVVPTIVSLREKVDAILAGELERSHAWMQHLREADRDNITILVHAVVNKILHDPITGLKEESQDHAARPYVAALRRLFHLEN